MTKQQKIREGMYDVAMGMAGYQKLTPARIESMVREQLRFLGNEGVVIKVDAERLEYKLDYPDSHFKGKRPSFIFAPGQVRRNNQMLKAGYVAVEPLGVAHEGC